MFNVAKKSEIILANNWGVFVYLLAQNMPLFIGPSPIHIQHDCQTLSLDVEVCGPDSG